MMDIKISFGEKIRKLRKEKGFSQESFAAACKIHRTYMGLIERGKTNVTIENIEKMAKILKVDIPNLFN